MIWERIYVFIKLVFAFCYLIQMNEGNHSSLSNSSHLKKLNFQKKVGSQEGNRLFEMGVHPGWHLPAQS